VFCVFFACFLYFWFVFFAFRYTTVYTSTTIHLCGPRYIYIVELVTGCYNRTTWLAPVTRRRCLCSSLSRLRAAWQYTHATGDMDLLVAGRADYWQSPRDVTYRTVRLKLGRLWAAMNKRWNGPRTVNAYNTLPLGATVVAGLIGASTTFADRCCRSD